MRGFKINRADQTTILVDAQLHCMAGMGNDTMRVLSYPLFVYEQICERASNTHHHINRAKRFTENSAMARLWDILMGRGPIVTKDLYYSTWIGLKRRGPGPSYPL